MGLGMGLGSGLLILISDMEAACWRGEGEKSGSDCGGRGMSKGFWGGIGM